MADKKYINYIIRSTSEINQKSKEEFFNIHIKSIKEKRVLYRDLLIISLGIIGFIIPLLFNNEIDVNEILMSISILYFFILIIYGVFYLIYNLRKDLYQIPFAQNDLENKVKQIRELCCKYDNNSLTDTRDFLIELDNIIDKENDKKIPIDHDIIFFGLFIISLILFISSLFIK